MTASQTVLAVACLLVLAIASSSATTTEGGTKPRKAAVRWLMYARSVIKGAHKDDSLAPFTPDGYFQLSKLRQEMFCIDTEPLSKVPQPLSASTQLDANTVMRQIAPEPLYITVYQGKQDIVSDHILQGQTWESQELQIILWALQAPLPPDAAPTSTIGPALFVDVGANVGAFTLHVASAGFEVVSFEAMGDNQRLLRTSLCASHPSIMSRVTLHPFGLGAYRDTCYLIVDYNWGNGIPVCGARDATHALELHGNRPGFQVRDAIEIERMDDVIQSDIKVMKIDVEGFEPFVIKGAADVLQKRTVWFVVLEWNIERLMGSTRGKGEEPVDHLLKLQSMGYRVSRQAFRGPFMSREELIAMAQAGLRMTPGNADNFNIWITHPRVVLPTIADSRS